MRKAIGRRVYWPPVDHPVSEEADENDEDPGEDIDHIVVRGDNDRGGHHRRTHDREASQRDVGRRAPDRDTGKEIPAEVEARKRRELVRQARRLECPVRTRVERDRVDEARLGQARRRHREERKEHEPDRARDQHRVSEQAVASSLAPEENDRDRDDHWPVPPNVSPVGERDENVVRDDPLLEPWLPREVN
jgi:hypothetical protein